LEVELERTLQKLIIGSDTNKTMFLIIGALLMSLFREVTKYTKKRYSHFVRLHR